MVFVNTAGRSFWTAYRTLPQGMRSSTALFGFFMDIRRVSLLRGCHCVYMTYIAMSLAHTRLRLLTSVTVYVRFVRSNSTVRFIAVRLVLSRTKLLCLHVQLTVI